MTQSPSSCGREPCEWVCGSSWWSGWRTRDEWDWGGRGRGWREGKGVEREGWKEKGQREGWREKGQREGWREKGQREGWREKGEREGWREKGERERGREKGERERGRGGEGEIKQEECVIQTTAKRQI